MAAHPSCVVRGCYSVFFQNRSERCRPVLLGILFNIKLRHGVLNQHSSLQHLLHCKINKKPSSTQQHQQQQQYQKRTHTHNKQVAHSLMLEAATYPVSYQRTHCTGQLVLSSEWPTLFLGQQQRKKIHEYANGSGLAFSDICIDGKSSAISSLCHQGDQHRHEE